MKLHILASWAVIAFCLTAAGCAKPGGAAKAFGGDVAVARVDGRPILKSDVTREAVAQGLLGEGEPLDASSELFQRVLDEVVDQRLLAAEAVRRGLDRDPSAERRVAAARERILADMVVERAVAKAVDEKAVRALYQEQLKLGHSGEGAPPTLEASRAQIVRFLTYAQVGELLKSLRGQQRVELLTPRAGTATKPGTAPGAEKLKGQL